MKVLVLPKVILFVTLLGLTTASNRDCPPWSFPDAENGTRCVCSGVLTNTVKCSKDTAILSISSCITYNSATEDTEVGPCPYVSQHINLSSDTPFFRLPNHTSNLTSFMCGSLHRQGLLCGECENGFGPTLHSYKLECKKCWGHGAGWLLYITLTVIPTTVLYIIVVVFHVSAPSPPLNAFILFCHITVYTFRLQPVLYFFIGDKMGGFSHWLLKVMLALCGLWNLDFFCPIVPPFCVSPNMKNLHAFALEYIEAFYPLILILITYICIKLHDHNFRAVVLLWKPFHWCFVYFRSHWDSKGSLINAFATFLLLSFTKMLFVSFNLLYAIKPMSVNRNGTLLSSNLVLYYDSTVEFFSKDHLPFAAVSICVGLLFTIFPTFLLISYPTRIFRKCVACCGFRRWYALYTFMEAFQGQYKDGTNRTRDFRMVSALYLVFRIAAVLEYLGNHDRGNHAYGWLATTLVLVSASLFFAIARPYKVNYLNATDSLLLALLGIEALLAMFAIYLPNQRYSHLIAMGGLLIMGTPHAVLVVYILYSILKKFRILQCLNRKCRYILGMVCWNKYSLTDNRGYSGLDTDSLPDRLVNPDEYEPLIPAVNHREHHTESFAVPARVTPMNTYGIVDE